MGLTGVFREAEGKLPTWNRSLFPLSFDKKWVFNFQTRKMAIFFRKITEKLRPFSTILYPSKSKTQLKITCINHALHRKTAIYMYQACDCQTSTWPWIVETIVWRVHLHWLQVPYWPTHWLPLHVRYHACGPRRHCIVSVFSVRDTSLPSGAEIVDPQPCTVKIQTPAKIRASGHYTHTQPTPLGQHAHRLRHKQ